MKITVIGTQLAHALLPCVGVVENNPTIPILSNIRISKVGGKLQIVGSDLETTVTTYCEAKINGDESFTVSARKLAALITELPSDSEVKIDLSENSSKFVAGKSRFKLQTLPGADYPIPSPTEEQGSISVNAAELAKALDHTLPSAAMNDVRYYLNGINMEIEKDKVTVVSTDGHRLAINEASAVSDFESSFILPRKAATLLRKLLKTCDTVTIKHLNTMVEFTVGDVTVLSKLIDGKFPDWKRVVPQNSILAHVNVVDMQNAIRRASIVLTEMKQKGTTLSFEKSAVTITAKSDTDSNEAVDQFNIDYSGVDIGISVNALYLSDALATIDDTATFAISDKSDSSFIVRPKDKAMPLHVIMPMRL